MAKYLAEVRDPYLDPKSNVLRNRFGLQDQHELEQVEARFAALRSVELAQSPQKGHFDLSHLQAIHHHLFGDVYEWAGQIRQVEISKGTTGFARTVAIASAAERLFKQLAKENYLCGLDPDKFSERAGYYLGEVNILHPFRDGNGRTQREFFNQLMQRSGYRFEWAKVSREAMIEACIYAYHGNHSQMTTLIRENLFEVNSE